MNSEIIIQKLKSDKKRLTPGRVNIVKLFCNANSPITADFIVKKTGLNKTSVYREIEFLTKEKYLQDVEFGDGTKRYELTSLDHHHHLICLKCKDVEDVKVEEQLSEEEKLIEKYKKFKVIKHNLEFFGYCKKCI